MTNNQIIERLQQISMELVDKYYASARYAVCETSEDIEKGLDKLNSKTQRYKDELLMLLLDVDNNE